MAPQVILMQVVRDPHIENAQNGNASEENCHITGCSHNLPVMDVIKKIRSKTTFMIITIWGLNSDHHVEASD